MARRFLSKTSCKITLINPSQSGVYEPSLRELVRYTAADDRENSRSRFLPPIDLAYVGGLLKKAGFKVSLIDANLHNYSEEKLGSLISDEHPDIVIITSSPRHQWRCPLVSVSMVTSSARVVKNFKKSIKTIIIGVHGTYNPAELIANPYIDYVVSGEPEYACVRLVKAIVEGDQIPKGVSCKTKNKQLVIATKHAKPFDFCVWPAYDLLEVECYQKRGELYSLEGSFMLVETARGCPYNCIYCLKAMFGSKYKVRSPVDVINEIKYLNVRFGVNSICFVDETFVLNHHRIFKICEKLYEEKLDISWWCQTRPDRIPKSLLRSMQKSGCKQIDYGVESLNQIVLDKLEKQIDVSNVLKTLKLTRYQGLNQGVFLLLFAPGDTIESMVNSISQVIDLGVNIIFSSIIVPYPTTPLWKKAIMEGKVKRRDWKESVEIAGTVCTPFSRSQVTKLVPKIWQMALEKTTNLK